MGSELEETGFQPNRPYQTVAREKTFMDISPQQQTFLDVRTDTTLSGHDLGKFKPVEDAGRPCFARLVEFAVALW